jgi:hypothetical protein
MGVVLANVAASKRQIFEKTGEFEWVDILDQHAGFVAAKE